MADVLGTLLHEAARATGTIRAWTGLRPLRAACSGHPRRWTRLRADSSADSRLAVDGREESTLRPVPHSHSREASPGRWSCSHIQSVRDDVEPLERRLRSV